MFYISYDTPIDSARETIRAESWWSRLVYHATKEIDPLWLAKVPQALTTKEKVAVCLWWAITVDFIKRLW